MTRAEIAAIWISIGGIIALVFLIVFSEHGLVDYRALKSKETGVLEKLETEKTETRALESEVHSLKTDLEYIKHIAKHEHDMAEPDELIFKQESDAEEGRQ